MKVLCPYCDSYIDADFNTVCPNCGGELSEAINEEKAKENELELKKEKMRLEAEEDERFLELGAGIAAVALGVSAAESKPIRTAGRIVKKLINSDK